MEQQRWTNPLKFYATPWSGKVIHTRNVFSMSFHYKSFFVLPSFVNLTWFCLLSPCFFEISCQSIAQSVSCSNLFTSGMNFVSARVSKHGALYFFPGKERYSVSFMSKHGSKLSFFRVSISIYAFYSLLISRVSLPEEGKICAVGKREFSFLSKKCISTFSREMSEGTFFPLKSQLTDKREKEIFSPYQLTLRQSKTDSFVDGKYVSSCIFPRAFYTLGTQMILKSPSALWPHSTTTISLVMTLRSKKRMRIHGFFCALFAFL